LVDANIYSLASMHVASFYTGVPSHHFRSTA